MCTVCQACIKHPSSGLKASEASLPHTTHTPHTHAHTHLKLLHCHPSSPSLPSPLIGTIKPPTTAKNAHREEDGKREEEEVLPATGEGQRDNGSAVEEMVNEVPVRAEEGEREVKDEATGERIGEQLQRLPEVEQQGMYLGGDCKP